MRKVADYDTLIDTIITTVRPQAWGENPEIAAMPTAKSIIVMQTREVHDEILELLRTMRTARRAGEPAKGE